MPGYNLCTSYIIQNKFLIIYTGAKNVMKCTFLNRYFNFLHRKTPRSRPAAAASTKNRAKTSGNSRNSHRSCHPDPTFTELPSISKGWNDAYAGSTSFPLSKLKILRTSLSRAASNRHSPHHSLHHQVSIHYLFIPILQACYFVVIKFCQIQFVRKLWMRMNGWPWVRPWICVFLFLCRFMRVV